jgi:hypothetical protein
MLKSLFKLGIINLILMSCQSSPDTLFELIEPDDSGITFENTIYEDDTYNILKFSYLYNGGGVSVGDFDNNGLTDIFFTGNMVENKMYLNQGDFKFTDITKEANVGALGKWMYGSASIDINNDGWLDLYVCASISRMPEERINALYINQGLNDNGIPTFKDEAEAYGLTENGHSTHATFFDYDLDGDLDLYILSNSKIEGIPTSYRHKVKDGSADNTDKLYRNNGNGTFTDVSDEAGILIEGFGLGIGLLDVNKDGAPDIYVGNDYITNDLLYVNDGEGKFSDNIDSMIKHQSRFSMGNDVADINNDGLMDIYTLDMLPETNLRKKTVMMANGYIVYLNDFRYGYTHQHVRNMLQLNNGNQNFSEIGQLAGIQQTEWSWSPLFADFDNDGYKDLLVTNGYPKDITDNDFISFRKEANLYTPTEQLLEMIPVVRIPNYAFKNNGDLTFEDVSTNWGFTQPSFSNGAAFADFDNDGDLDYVVNNINMPAFLYRNTANDQEHVKNHYLRIDLKGTKQNPKALGAKVTIHYDGDKIQYHEHNIYRGYVSTVEDKIHFGLGSSQTIDQLTVIWPDQKVTTLSDLSADQTISIDYQKAAKTDGTKDHEKPLLMTEISAEIGADFTHIENDYIDYNIQRNIPHKFSQSGPAVAVGDINGDELDDFYIGGSKDQSGHFFVQSKDGKFTSKPLLSNVEGIEEDMGSLLFDADNDGDQDLYVVSGSFEYPSGSDYFQDRLYINDGQGNFNLNLSALPPIKTSGSTVRAADYDADGDLDLFVGGRVIVGSYPFAPESYILQNDAGVFTDITHSVSRSIKNKGMITDALWSDYNGDGRMDLIVIGEFMNVTFYKNEGGQLIEDDDTGVNQYTGWWNSIVSGDFDQDGDMDYVVGNVGENNFYCASPDQPLRITAKDFDKNGAVDAILSCYFKAEDGTMKPFPIHSWNELNAQSPIFRARFQQFKEFGVTTIDELFRPGELEGALILEANHLSTSYLENTGKGDFVIKKLPVEAQFAPVNGMLVEDVNNDDHLDVICIGNDFGNEVNTGQFDAITGLVLLGDGKGSFSVSKSAQSGFFVNGDGKALAKLISEDDQPVFIASQNKDRLLAFKSAANNQKIINTDPLDAYAIINYTDGRKEKRDVNYGSGYLSQSSRKLVISPNANSIEVFSFDGQSRLIEFIEKN